jgi:hypothetical protein
MVGPMRRTSSRAALALLVLVLACQAQEPPVANKQPEVQAPKPAAEPLPKSEPAPPQQPAVPPGVIPEGCKVVIQGEDQTAVKRALVNTSTGGIYDTTIADGRVIEFECPPVAERKGANIIAEKDNAALVHWAGVDLNPGGEQAINSADAKPNLPEGLDEGTLARLRAKWPDLAKWDEPAMAAKPEGAPSKPAPAEEKIPVSFSAHQLYWAELRLDHVESKKVTRVVLDPKAQKSLVPGKYQLSVKLEDKGAWQSAGELEIVAGKKSYSVQMLDGPPRPQVSDK